MHWYPILTEWMCSLDHQNKMPNVFDYSGKTCHNTAMPLGSKTQGGELTLYYHIWNSALKRARTNIYKRTIIIARNW